MDISVVGLGKLGAPLMACLAHKGHHVIGVDVNPRTVQLINEGALSSVEPGLASLMRQAGSRISATSDMASAIARTEATFIIVPTPSDDTGAFSLRYVLPVVEGIGDALRDKETYHLVVLVSTVLPGATDNQVRPALEARSGKRCGPDFGLCFSPVFVALGSVIRTMLNPDLLLLGQTDQRSGDLLADILRTLRDNAPPIVRMNTVNAELVKLAVSTFVTTKISYANMLAEVCERLPGADVDVVTSAMGLDSRIGARGLTSGLGYGGPCFPRDNLALMALARHIGADAALAEATERLNGRQMERLAELVLSRLPPGGRVGILGLSFKPHTDVVEEAPGLLLADYLLGQGVAVVLYDPVAMETARHSLDSRAVFAVSFAECARQADVVVLATPWDEFKELSDAHLNRANGRPVVIDCWRLLDEGRFGLEVEYVTLGKGLSERPYGVAPVRMEAHPG